MAVEIPQKTLFFRNPFKTYDAAKKEAKMNAPESSKGSPKASVGLNWQRKTMVKVTFPGMVK